MILADVVPSVPSTPGSWTDLLWTIAQQYGLLGILFCLVIYALIRRDKELSDERSQRLVDAKGVVDMVKNATAAEVEYTATMKAMTVSIERLTEKLAGKS
jgi:hypothetical protein